MILNYRLFPQRNKIQCYCKISKEANQSHLSKPMINEHLIRVDIFSSATKSIQLFCDRDKDNKFIGNKLFAQINTSEIIYFI